MSEVLHGSPLHMFERAILMPGSRSQTRFDATLRVTEDYLIERVQSAFKVIRRGVSIRLLNRYLHASLCVLFNLGTY
jgi:hypothetical protein